VSLAGAALPLPRVALFKRLFVWSVLLEPLFFFVLFDEAVTGVTGNLSRILQFAVCVVLAGRLVVRVLLQARTVPIPNPWHPNFRHYTNLMLLSVTAGLIGYVSGAYELPAYPSVI